MSIRHCDSERTTGLGHVYQTIFSYMHTVMISTLLFGFGNGVGLEQSKIGVLLSMILFGTTDYNIGLTLCPMKLISVSRFAVLSKTITNSGQQS